MNAQSENSPGLDATGKAHKKARSMIVARLYIMFIILSLSIFCMDASALQITKKGSSNQAAFGDIVIYTYEVTNNNSFELHDVLIHDDRLGEISLGDLGIGEKKSHAISHSIIEEDYPGPLNNEAWATGKSSNGTSVRSNNASWEIALGFEGNLAVSKKADVVNVRIGDSINYTITIKNPNGFALKNISVQDLIYHPVGIGFDVPLNKTFLLPGESAVGTLKYTVTQYDIIGPPRDAPGLSPAMVTDLANAVAFPPWSDPDDPHAHKVSNVATRNNAIHYTTDQSLRKSASLREGAKGDRATFNITVQNTGDTLINRSELKDLLPDGLKFISSIPPITSSTSNSNGSTTLYWGNLSQSFGTILLPGKSFEVKVTSEFTGSKYGKLTNRVSSTVYNLRNERKISTSSADVYAMKQNIAVIKKPDISMGAPDAVVNYTLQVQNTGNISLNNVFVSDTLPEGMSYVSSSGGGSNLGSHVNWSDIGPLAIGSTKQLWVQARINGPVSQRRTLTNHVYAEGKPQFGYNISNSTSADVEALEANITITKGADPAFGSPGTIVTFTLNVTNNGIAPLPHVTVNDLLPAGMSYLSSSPPGTALGRNVSWADIGPLGSGESKQIRVAAKIDGPVSGIKTLTNRVEVSGSPEHGGNVSASALATVQSGEARVDVIKQADPSFGSPSTNVTFSLDVTNSGAVLLPHVSVIDQLPEGMSYVSSTPAGVRQGQNLSWPDIGPLAAGESKRLEIVAHIDTPITGSKTLTNGVIVSAMPEHGDNVTANASAQVLAREARIDVLKGACPAFGSPGSLVTFSIDVTNSGAARLPHVFVGDTLPEGMSYISSTPAAASQGQKVLWADIGPLDSGERRRLEIVARIDSPISGNITLTNLVQVSARPEHGQNVTANSSVDVLASEAKICVAKAAEPAFGSAGTIVTFTLNVTNTGAASLPVVSVRDLLPEGMSYLSSYPGGSSQGQRVIWPNIGPMSPGSSKKLEIVARLDGPVSGNLTLTNQVEVTGMPQHGQNVTARDSKDVLASEAKVAISKAADPSFGSPGTTVVFTVDVTNNGSALLPHVFVSDLLPAGMSYLSSHPEGSGQGQNVYWSDIGPMAPGSSKRLLLKAHIDAPVSGNVTLTNQVQVSAQPEHGQNVTASASAEVRASEAKIAISKVANPVFGSPGTSVTFTMDVANSGAAPLMRVSVSDLLPAGMSYVSSDPAGSNQGQQVMWPDIGLMAPGESRRLQIIARIDGPLSGIKDLINQVQAVGQPEHGGNVTANATAAVQAREAKVGVTKIADPDFGSPGTDVTFSINVTNDGSALLPNVLARDLLPAGMSYISSSPAGSNQGQNVLWPDIGPMEPGASRQLEIVARIDSPITGSIDLTNQVDISAKPEHGDNVTASASASLLTSEARISVIKSAQPAYGSPGTSVAFDLEVENTGVARLPHVLVRDHLPAGMSYISSDPAGTNQGQQVVWPDIGPMDSGEIKRLQILANIDGPILGSENFTNLVDVAGKPEHGDNVTASDTAFVRGQEAKIAVEKKADPSFGSPGTIVTFSLEVKNEGQALLPHVFVSDLLPSGLSYVSSSPAGSNDGQIVSWPDIGPMAPGSSKRLKIMAHIDGPLSGIQNLTNQVTVAGKPEYGENVTASASATVQASEAGISIVKSAEPSSGSPGTAVGFSLEVTNTGSAALPHVSVSDLLPGGMSYISSTPAAANQGQKVFWSDIGPMAPGESRQLQIIALIDGPLSGSQTLTNQVNVTGKPEHGKEVTASASADVLAKEASISVVKSANPSFGSPGAEVLFTMDVTNTGAAALPHVSASDLLPGGMSYLSSSPAGTNQGQKVFWPDIGPMAPGESRQLKITARITGPLSGSQTLTNQVEVIGQPEHGQNVTASNSAEVSASEARIAVNKRADPASGSPGATVTFTIDVTNSGAAPLLNVAASDQLPAGMSYLSSSPAGSNQGQNVLWPNIGPMASGESRKLEIVARIDGPISGSQTLTNLVEAAGQPEHGENVSSSASADVLAREAKISVIKSADPAFGTIGSILTFKLNVTNNGEALLSPVFVSDLLPEGLEYLSSSQGGVSSGRYINWTDIGPLQPGETEDLWIKVRMDGTVYGSLVNRVDVVGRPEHGEDISASSMAVVEGYSSGIGAVKTAGETDGLPGSTVNFTLVVANVGATEICNITAEDLLPEGLRYMSDEHQGKLNEEGRVIWEDLGCLKPGEKVQIEMIASITGTDFGELENRFLAEGTPVGSNERVKCEARANVTAVPSPFIITKTADKPVYRPGEEMTYTITICNPLDYFPLKDVVVKDVFDNSKVRVVASYPEPGSDGQWHFAQILNKSCETITVVAVYPQSNITFDKSQNVSGRGFVNVHSDLTTGMASMAVTNCVYATARVGSQTWSRQSCASVEIREIGTDLQVREHGSGLYRSDESTRLLSLNRSIISRQSTSALYAPEAFQLPNDRKLNYSSQWAEKTRGKNYVTGASMHEAYRHATDIDRETYIRMDENGSQMRLDSRFNGTASIGFSKRSAQEGAGTKPIFEAQEEYSGQFQLNESFQEYGSSAASERAASGVGYVSSDRRTGQSQRSYESGTGSYSIEEKIDTFSNYMAKDISLAHKAVNLSRPSAAPQELKWREGMWSKSGSLQGGVIVAKSDQSGSRAEGGCAPANGTSPASIISESYSSLDYLKKDAVSLGLSEMRSNATFKGVADYRAKATSSNGTDLIDSEDRYIGEFTTTRSIALSGVSNYDQPHISIRKEGRIRPEWFDRKNLTVAEYNISITNDGNCALAPLYVQDLLPPGTEYIGSSLQPVAIGEDAVNWTVLHLGIGDTLSITLKLNVTESAPGNLLNRAEVSGMARGRYVTASAYSSIEHDWIGCCQPMMALEKEVRLDPIDPFLVHYAIILKNNANGSMAARLDDDLPGGMSLIKADPVPASYDGEHIHWVIADIGPDQVMRVEYTVRASGNGNYINNVHLDASSIDGSGSYSSTATSYLDLGHTGRRARTTLYDGWQPPDWDIDTSEGEGI